MKRKSREHMKAEGHEEGLGLPKEVFMSSFFM
jgi:hypothetical protein